MDIIPKEDWRRIIFIDAGYEDERVESRFDWPETTGPGSEHM
jgi:hypothetical protein